MKGQINVITRNLATIFDNYRCGLLSGFCMLQPPLQRKFIANKVFFLYCNDVMSKKQALKSQPIFPLFQRQANHDIDKDFLGQILSMK